MKLDGPNCVDMTKYNQIGVANEVFIKVYNIILEEVLVRRIYKIQIDPFMFRFNRSASYHVIKYVNTILNSC